VLERRSEIGLRRALGATRRHIALQFITEALLLSAFGGVAGATLGALATAAYAATQSWTAVVPPLGLAGGIGAAVITGVVAGSYPAVRAARLAPTDALRTV
jgi:putative ABC transport system permease protein